MISVRKYCIVLIICFHSLQGTAKDFPASLFGIHSDGVTLNTRSIQFAIDFIHKQGGGRLVFDVGRFLTGSIHLKSNVTIHLKEGAVLLGTLNPLDYDRNIFTALILSYKQENVAVTGIGVIDGQGRQVARNVVELVHKGLIKDAFRNDRPEAEIRPMLIYFRECKNILIKGVTMRNAAVWVQTYDQCRNIRVDSITVDSRAYWNNDGIDIVDCDSVSITNSYFDADDDAVCLKSHDSTGAFCQNIIVKNCTIRSSANGIKFGTASRGGFKNVKLINIRVFDTYRSAIALEAVDGGFLENVEADSIYVLNSGHAIFLRIGERWGKKSRLENIRIKNVKAEIAATKPDAGYEYEGPIEDMPRNISPPIIIAGLPGLLIKNVSFENIEIKHPGGGNPQFAKISLDELDKVPEIPASYPEFSKFVELPAWGVYIRHAKDIRFKNLKLSCDKKDYRTAIVLDDTHQAEFISTDIKEPSKKKPMHQHRSSEITFK